MKLDNLIVQRRTLNEKSSLISRRSARCLTLTEIEALAREGGAPDGTLCERCASLLEIFEDQIKTEMTNFPPIES